MIKSSHAVVQYIGKTLFKAAAELSHAFDIVANMLLKAGNKSRYCKYLHAISKLLHVRLCFCLQNADSLHSDKGRDLNKKYTC